jgi:hypothetical protein
MNSSTKQTTPIEDLDKVRLFQVISHPVPALALSFPCQDKNPTTYSSWKNLAENSAAEMREADADETRLFLWEHVVH